MNHGATLRLVAIVSLFLNGNQNQRGKGSKESTWRTDDKMGLAAADCLPGFPPDPTSLRWPKKPPVAERYRHLVPEPLGHSLLGKKQQFPSLFPFQLLQVDLPTAFFVDVKKKALPEGLSRFRKLPVFVWRKSLSLQ
jgi:hypothetical protein